MKIAISVESFADLPNELAKEYDIKKMSTPIIMDDGVYSAEEIKNQQIFDFAKEKGHLARTSCPNVNDYIKFFTSLKDEGYDKIIHFALSHGMSSSCQNAILASKEIDGVSIIDTLTCSTGSSLSAIDCRKNIDSGMSYEDAVIRANEVVKRVQTSFVVATTEYLAKNGRCSKLVSFGANLLHIRPIINVDLESGELKMGHLLRGPMSKVILKYVDETLQNNPNPDKSLVFITYSSGDEKTVEQVKQVLQENGFERIIINTAGSSIACHCGPGTLGILFINK